jgi:hypothetical protein
MVLPNQNLPVLINQFAQDVAQNSCRFCLLDFSNTSDLVPHELLSYTLNNYGLTPTYFNRLRNYVTNEQSQACVFFFWC